MTWTSTSVPRAPPAEMEGSASTQRALTRACALWVMRAVSVKSTKTTVIQVSVWTVSFLLEFFLNLEQKKANGSHAESAHRGVNWHSKYISQGHQQRPSCLQLTLTWHACQYKVHKHHSQCTSRNTRTTTKT